MNEWNGGMELFSMGKLNEYIRTETITNDLIEASSGSLLPLPDFY